MAPNRISLAIFLLLTGCGFSLSFKNSHKSNKQDLSYQFVENGCDTGKHSFPNKDSYCAALQDDKTNNYCALSLRINLIKKDCPDANTLPAEDKEQSEPVDKNKGAEKDSDKNEIPNPSSTSTVSRDTFTSMPFSQVSTPNDMVRCMNQYIQNWGRIGGGDISWENEPSYNWLGSFFAASWHTFAGYRTLSLTADSTSLVHCGYEIKEDGTPDNAKGFCKTSNANGTIEFELSNGEPLSKVKLADIKDYKIRCLNLLN